MANTFLFFPLLLQLLCGPLPPAAAAQLLALILIPTQTLIPRGSGTCPLCDYDWETMSTVPGETMLKLRPI